MMSDIRLARSIEDRGFEIEARLCWFGGGCYKDHMILALRSPSFSSCMLVEWYRTLHDKPLNPSVEPRKTCQQVHSLGK
eukprot:scaffold614_cov378-Pavlova_lutheri.AAC.4